jgi:glyoxylase-like metal-dependent hydrolase (beta-lactamase superfamily II)/rhodanese-related sulfurtransferase
MKVEQIYTGCLAQGAYYIESAGEAAIIDPLREIEPYLEMARKDGATIKYVLETHFHADFVSGHLDLAAKTGAVIVYGPTAEPKFKAHVAHDGEELSLGKLTIKVLHTPGHTLESVTYLLRDERGKDYAIFSGDTLFLGDVGRPDLAQKAAHLTQDALAGLLYHSLNDKIVPLADDVIVYPAHGAGSACGKHLAKETVDTLGHQKQTNYALRADMTREEFIREVTDGLLPAPAYFPENVKMNKEGYESIDQVLAQGLQALSPDAFERIANETGALLLDTRSPQVFAKGFLPRAINIGIDGGFAPWAGALIPGVSHPILLITDPGREKEAVTRLARVGYDHTLGYLKGGIGAWEHAGKETDRVDSITATAFAEQFKQNDLRVFDVRKPGEYAEGHVKNAANTPLDYLPEHLHQIPKTETVHLYCGSGYRSMIAASVLKSRGWTRIVEVAGGFQAIAQTNVPTTNVADRLQ